MTQKNHFHDIAGNELLGKLEADDVKMKLGEVKVLTIKRAFKQRMTDTATGEEHGTIKLIVEFAEFGGKGLVCNKTMGNAFAALVVAGFLPNDYEEITSEFKWGGLRVPMTVRNFEYQNVQYPKLCPVSSDTFEAQMKKAGVAQKKPASRRGR